MCWRFPRAKPWPRSAYWRLNRRCLATGCAFAKTREDRLKTNDTRLSLAERYPSASDRSAIIEQAAAQLVKDRLLLEADAKSYVSSTN